MKTIVFNGVTYTAPYFDVMPPLTAEERVELTADIRANGITYPVLVTEANEIIDGHNRLTIAAELGLTGVPISVLSGLTADQKRARAEDLNLHRRHLTTDQKRRIIAGRLKAAPVRSNRDIAKETATDHKTVGTVRKAMESTGEIPQLAATRGKDGRTRPTAKAKPERDDRPREDDAARPAKTSKPFGWWPQTGSCASSAALLAVDLRRLSKVKVSDRKPEDVLTLAKRFRRIVDELERLAATSEPTPNP